MVPLTSCIFLPSPSSKTSEGKKDGETRAALGLHAHPKTAFCDIPTPMGLYLELNFKSNIKEFWNGILDGLVPWRVLRKLVSRCPHPPPHRTCVACPSRRDWL